MAIPESAKLANGKGSSDVGIKDVLGDLKTAKKINEREKDKGLEASKSKLLQSSESSKSSELPKLSDLPEGASEDIEASQKQEEESTLEQASKQEGKKQKRGRGCAMPVPKCTCQSITCFGCLFFILLLVLCGSTLYFRPPFVWNLIKNYLNNGYKPTEYSSVSTDAVEQRLEKDFSQGKDTTLSEQELQSLASKALNVNDVRVDVEPNYMRIVTDVDNNGDHPLWLILEIGQQSDGNLKITKIGFNRFGAPSFLRNAISDSAFKALDLEKNTGGNDSTQLISSLVESKDNGFSLSNVRFDKDKVTLKGNVSQDSSK